ncbi:MAG TPA: hypothetical protein VFQ53_15665 [Kofleriaceae bacterium]|nr:hypothetical protein [Kofleriaceae bacterium]
MMTDAGAAARSYVPLVVGLAIACTHAGVALADPTAEARFREGRRLLKSHQLAEACAAFATSAELDTRTGTLLNLADCQEQRGQTATAFATFEQAKALAVRVGDKRREREADRRAAALEPRIPTLVIAVPRQPAIAGLVIRRNGTALDTSLWNTPLRLDPGDYTIEVTAPGYRSWTRVATIAPRQHATVVVESLVRDDAPPPSSTPPAVLAPAVAPAAALGVMVGASQLENAAIGTRATYAIALPVGELRGIGALSYTRVADEPTLPDLHTDTLTVAALAEYVWRPVPIIGFGGGLGLGIDFDFPEGEGDGRENDVGTWFGVVVSPLIVRLGRADAGLHVQLQKAGDELIVYGIAAVDWFLW